LGYLAGQNITTGTHNTAVGTNAMVGLSATPLYGSFNTAVGDTALNAIEATAGENTALGYEAGYAVTPLTTGSGQGLVFDGSIPGVVIDILTNDGVLSSRFVLGIYAGLLVNGRGGFSFRSSGGAVAAPIRLRPA
jgi:hypothetical protein